MCELLDSILKIRDSQHDRLSGTTKDPVGHKDQHIPVGSTNRQAKVDYYVSPGELKLAITRFNTVDGQKGHPVVRHWLTHGQAHADQIGKPFLGVVVEYDGEYYHKGERRKVKDHVKRNRMLANGYLVYKISSSAQGLLQSHKDGYCFQIYTSSEFNAKKLI
jgi:hypothetical protein